MRGEARAADVAILLRVDPGTGLNVIGETYSQPFDYYYYYYYFYYYYYYYYYTAQKYSLLLY